VLIQRKGDLIPSKSGVPVTARRRRRSIREQTYHRWKKKYGGLELSEA
jgi:hypothetical protein